MRLQKAAALAAALWLGLAMALKIAPSAADGLTDLVGLARVAGLNVDEEDARTAETAIRVLERATENQGRKTPPKPSVVTGYDNDDSNRPQVPVNVIVEVRIQDRPTFNWRRQWGEYDSLNVDRAAYEEAARHALASLQFVRVVEVEARQDDWREQDQNPSRFEDSTLPSKGYTWGAGFEMVVTVLFSGKSKEYEISADLGKFGGGVNLVDYGVTVAATLRDRTTSTRKWPIGQTTHKGIFTAYTQGGEFWVEYGRKRFPFPFVPSGLRARFSQTPGLEAIWGSVWQAANALDEEFVMHQNEVREYLARGDGQNRQAADDRLIGIVKTMGKESCSIVFNESDLLRVQQGQIFEVFTPLKGEELMEDAPTGVFLQIDRLGRASVRAVSFRGNLSSIREGYLAIESSSQRQAAISAEESEVITPMTPSQLSWVERLAASKAGEIFAEIQSGVDPGGGNFTVTPEPRTGESTGRLAPESPEYLVAMVVEQGHFPEEAAKWPIGLVVIAGIAGQPAAAKAVFFGPLDGDEDRYGIWVLPSAVTDFVAGLEAGWVFNAPTKKSEER